MEIPSDVPSPNTNGAKEAQTNGVHDQEADAKKANEERSAEAQAAITPVPQSDWMTSDNKTEPEEKEGQKGLQLN